MANASISRSQPVKAKRSPAKRTLTQAERFARLGLHSDADFMLHVPLRYEDETQLHDLSQIRPGQFVQADVEVTDQHIAPGVRRQLIVQVQDHTGSLRLRWLHFYPSLLKQLAPGQRVRIRGEVRDGFHGLELVHPKVTQADQPLAQALTPIYPTTDGLRQDSLAKAIQAAFSRTQLTDTLPEAIRQHFNLAEFAQALYTVHHPPKGADQQALLSRTHPAWARIKFDELLAQQLSLAAAREARRQQRAPVLQAQSDGSVSSLVAQLRAHLPFQLTAAQERVVHEIHADLQQPYPMHRLLQGDVGSGKTVVAALAAAQALAAGYQVAVMAPTEILAEQHYLKLAAWFAPLAIEVVWLSGSMTVKQRRPVLERLAQAEPLLIVGTQALIQEGVEFAQLGLIILDEQHRFGVGQRLALSKKGEQPTKGGGEAFRPTQSSAEPQDLASVASSPVNSALLPHQLSMSATPIPRTLAMSFLADLDVSVIDELPAGRKPIVTKLIADVRRDEILAYVAQQVAQGGQVYWVCPLVEESESLQLQTAVDTHHYLVEHLPGVQVGLVHGKLKAAEKAAVMDAFRANQVQVLVATTVIEVGVDVPNANLMIIEHAERFGLAQLHQLRGRVGRGAAQAVCVLLYQPQLSADGRARLRAMHETNDGFKIAQYDLELRGPGEFLGLRQSGQALLRFADLQTDAHMIEQAKACAQLLRTQYPKVAQAHLERWLQGREDLLRT